MWRRSPKTQNTVTQKDIGFVREKLEARLSWKKVLNTETLILKLDVMLSQAVSPVEGRNGNIFRCDGSQREIASPTPFLRKTLANVFQ